MIIDDKILQILGPIDTIVYTIIAENPNITHAEISNRCNITARTVINVIKRLSDKHYIKIKVNKPHPNTYEVLHDKKRPTKKSFGMFGHVQLSELEYKMLLDKYPESFVANYIQTLDSHLENNPDRKYKSHCAEIVKWILQDENKKKHYKNTKSLAEIKETENKAKRYADVVNNFSHKTVVEPDIETKINYEILRIYQLNTKGNFPELILTDIKKNAKKSKQSIHDYIMQSKKPGKNSYRPALSENQCELSYFEMIKLFNLKASPAEVYDLQDEWKKYYQFKKHVKEALENASEECKARIFSGN